VTGRRRHAGRAHQYPRAARVNEVLREIVAEELERLAEVDPRVELLTVTGVETEPDLRHATVFLASLPDAARLAVDEHRVRLQAAIARQVRLKRTPQLSFTPDPAVLSGVQVEEVLRRLRQAETPGASESRAGDDDVES